MLEDYVQETILEQNKVAASSDRSVHDDVHATADYLGRLIKRCKCRRVWRRSRTGHACARI